MLNFTFDPVTTPALYTDCVLSSTTHLGAELAMIPTCTPFLPSLGAERLDRRGKSTSFKTLDNLT